MPPFGYIDETSRKIDFITALAKRCGVQVKLKPVRSKVIDFSHPTEYAEILQVHPISSPTKNIISKKDMVKFLRDLEGERIRTLLPSPPFPDGSNNDSPGKKLIEPTPEKGCFPF